MTISGCRSSCCDLSADRCLFLLEARQLAFKLLDLCLDLSKQRFLISKDGKHLDGIVAVRDIVAAGGRVLFVGTKRQAQAIIREEAKRCNMFYVDHRWLGGMMTNFQTIKTSVDRLKSIESMQADGSINRFPKKEILLMEKERVKLERNVGGIKNMRKLPDVLFVIDPRKEEIAVNEAQKLNIPVVALTDTNCSPAGIEHLIPNEVLITERVENWSYSDNLVRLKIPIGISILLFLYQIWYLL